MLGLVLLGIFASPYAMAQDSGWYGGLNLGRTQASIDEARIANGLMGGAAAVSSMSERDTTNGLKLYGGYQLNRNIAIEAGYYNLGKYGFSATTVPPGTLDGTIRLRGLNIDLVGIMPLTEKFSVFGRIGAAQTQARDSFSGTGAAVVAVSSTSRRDTNLKVGLGMEYKLTPAVGVRAEFERYRINDGVGNRGDVDMMSVGLVYRFGARTPTPAPQVYSAPYVAPVVTPAPPPPPAPIVMAPPPPAPPPAPIPVYQAPPAPRPVAAPVVVRMQADSLFDFDKSAVKAEGRTALDKFVADLRGSSYDKVDVIGHTDRLGSSEYNAKLSTRRADAVKDYLVQNGGLPSAKVAARGVGETQPVTKAEDCKGTRQSPKLIACLQPDRRVELHVTATRQ